MDKPKELVELFAQKHAIDACIEQIEKFQNLHKIESSLYEKILKRKKCKHWSIRIVRFFQAAQGYEESVHPSYTADQVDYLELKDAAIVCRVGRWSNVEEIPFNILCMSNEDFAKYLKGLREARRKQRTEAEKEEREIEEIQDYLSILEDKPELEKKLAQYKKKYGGDVVLLEKRLEMES